MFMSAQHDGTYLQEPDQHEDIQENNQPMHEEEPIEDDQIMAEHDEREFEVHLEEENNLTPSNDMQNAAMDEQPTPSQQPKDITTLVDHLQLPDSYELLGTFLSNLD